MENINLNEHMSADDKQKNGQGFEYNTGRRALKLPEYGRNVQKMVDYLKSIEDRDKRNEQAQAVVKVMELLNPQVHLQDDYEHKLWDHLQIIADFELDVDSPYPKPEKESLNTAPERIPVEKRPMKASHYGRNVQNMIDLVASVEDAETRNQLILNLASFMKMQYLIWNKDNVEDATIFSDIVKLSNGKITIPEGMEIGKLQNFDSRGTSMSSRANKNRRNNKQKNHKK